MNVLFQLPLLAALMIVIHPSVAYRCSLHWLLNPHQLQRGQEVWLLNIYNKNKKDTGPSPVMLTTELYIFHRET